jgi:hypothetical protein
MSNVNYNYGKKTVRIVLGTISTYDLEGTFEDIIDKLNGEFKQYKDYITSPQTVPAGGYYTYLDGEKNKKLQFDSLHLEWHSTYDDEKQLQIIGERAMDASELAAWDAQVKKGQEQEKEQLRRLKAKYPDV